MKERCLDLMRLSLCNTVCGLGEEVGDRETQNHTHTHTHTDTLFHILPPVPSELLDRSFL